MSEREINKQSKNKSASMRSHLIAGRAAKKQERPGALREIGLRTEASFLEGIETELGCEILHFQPFLQLLVLQVKALDVCWVSELLADLCLQFLHRIGSSECETPTLDRICYFGNPIQCLCCFLAAALDATAAFISR